MGEAKPQVMVCDLTYDFNADKGIINQFWDNKVQKSIQLCGKIKSRSKSIDVIFEDSHCNDAIIKNVIRLTTLFNLLVSVLATPCYHYLERISS